MAIKSTRAQPFKYLCLAGDLPGEGFWSDATSYDALVAHVQRSFGEDFIPLFKYKIQASPQGAEEELRYHSSSAYRHVDNRTPKKKVKIADESVREGNEKGGGEREDEVDYPCGVKIREAGMTGMCFVIMDDAADFDIWLYGGGLLEHPDHTKDDPAELHYPGCASQEGRGRPAFQPLTQKLFVFRKTSLDTPRMLSHDQDAAHSSYHPYYHTVTNKDGIFRFRSSPAVKHASEDVVRTPIHSLLPPLLLVQLNITCVLRHSNASEVILWSAKQPLAGGVGWWGQLLHKASLAWGVHRPALRYVDLSSGVQEMTITDVLNFRVWSEGVGLDRPELLVLEQAPSSHLCYDAFLKDQVRRHCAAHPPHLPHETTVARLVEKLHRLEDQERDASVRRPKPVYQERLAASAAGEPKEARENANSEGFPVDIDRIIKAVDQSMGPAPTHDEALRTKQPRVPSKPTTTEVEPEGETNGEKLLRLPLISHGVSHRSHVLHRHGVMPPHGESLVQAQHATKPPLSPTQKANFPRLDAPSSPMENSIKEVVMEQDSRREVLRVRTASSQNSKPGTGSSVASPHSSSTKWHTAKMVPLWYLESVADELEQHGRKSASLRQLIEVERFIRLQSGEQDDESSDVRLGSGAVVYAPRSSHHVESADLLDPRNLTPPPSQVKRRFVFSSGRSTPVEEVPNKPTEAKIINKEESEKEAVEERQEKVEEAEKSSASPPQVRTKVDLPTLSEEEVPVSKATTPSATPEGVLALLFPPSLRSGHQVSKQAVRSSLDFGPSYTTPANRDSPAYIQLTSTEQQRAALAHRQRVCEALRGGQLTAH